MSNFTMFNLVFTSFSNAVRQPVHFTAIALVLLCGWVRAETTRLGLLARDENHLAALELAEVELSGRKDIEIIERARLALVMREMDLTAAGLNQTDTLALGRQVRADGLLRVETVNVRGIPTLVMSLSAVRPGAILAVESTRSPPERPDDLAALLVAFCKTHLPKLRVPAEELVAVTVLPVGFEVMGFHTVEMEDRMTRLLTTTLTMYPQIAVLDREHLDDFLFDMFFTEGAAGEFWKSAAVLRARAAEGGEDTDTLRFHATLMRPGQTDVRLEGTPFEMTEWARGMTELSEKITSTLGVSAPELDDQARSAEAARLAEQAMRFYRLDLERSLRFANAAWLMGDRSRDVTLIRTQTRLQDLYMYPREAVTHRLGGVPPTLIRFHGPSEAFVRIYGPPGHPAQQEKILRGLIELQAEVLSGVEQWRGERRGWIPLKTAMLHAMVFQGQIYLQGNLETMLPLARENARLLRKGVDLLHELDEYDNLFLVSALEGSIHVLWETPEPFYASLESRWRRPRFSPDVLSGLTLAAGREISFAPSEAQLEARPHLRNQPVRSPLLPHTALVPIDGREWRQARVPMLERLAARTDLAAKVYTLHIQTHYPDSGLPVEDAGTLRGRVRALLGQPDAAREPEAVAHLRALDNILKQQTEDQTLPSPAEIAFQSVQDLFQEGLPEDREAQTEAREALRSTYLEHYPALFSGFSLDKRLETLHLLATAGLETLGPHPPYVSLNARAWLAYHGQPLPPLLPPQDREVILVGHLETLQTFQGKPGHMIRQVGRNDPRYIPFQSQGRRWVYDLHELTLHGFDPKGELPNKSITLPSTRDPAGKVYQRVLYPLVLNEDWVLFHSRIHFYGRGRVYALNIKTGEGFEHFPHDGSGPDWHALFDGRVGLPFGGVIQDDDFYYSHVTVGQGNNSSPGDTVYRLNLRTGDQTVIMRRRDSGPFDGSRNPPRNSGHLVNWRDRDIALLRVSHNRREDTWSLEANIFHPGRGEWSREVTDLAGKVEPVHNRIRLEQSQNDPRHVWLAGQRVFDTRKGALRPTSEIFGGTFQFDLERWVSFFDHPGEDGATVRYLMASIHPNNQPFEFNRGVIRTTIGDNVTRYPLDPGRVPGFKQDPLARKALSGDPQAQMALSRRHLGVPGAPGDFRKAFFWCARAAEQGHPEAILAMPFFLMQGLVQYNGFVVRGKTASAWIQRGLDAGDPWAAFAAALLPANQAGSANFDRPYFTIPPWDADIPDMLRHAAEHGVAPALRRWASELGRQDAPERDPVLAYAAMAQAERLHQKKTGADAMSYLDLYHHQLTLYNHARARSGVPDTDPFAPLSPRMLERLSPQDRQRALRLAAELGALVDQNRNLESTRP